MKRLSFPTPGFGIILHTSIRPGLDKERMTQVASTGHARRSAPEATGLSAIAVSDVQMLETLVYELRKLVKYPLLL
jgi:hypothetical protein